MRIPHKLSVSMILISTIFLGACSSGAAATNVSPTQTSDPTQASSGSRNGLSADLLGAGASFPAPIYLEWIAEYISNIQPGVSINYQSIGSGGGVEQFIGQQTDFGASDAFLKEDEIADAQAARGCDPIHIPTVFGAVSIGYNLGGIDGLTLSGPLLADIFLGNIDNWSDPAIVDLNPGVTLPDEDIIVAHRSDGSGTTSIFTTYLSSVSDAWANGPGAGKEVEWPAPNSVGGEKNDGVAAQIQQNPGAIGYIELSYAITNNIPVADMINADGNAITPTLESTAAAADGIEIPDDLRFNILNVGGEGYPIAGATWILAWTCGYDAESETAPLLLTAFGAFTIVPELLGKPQAALPLIIYNEARGPFEPAHVRAWAGALELMLLVLILTLIARTLSRRSQAGR
jgi:phosphate transport system substrate-binding protein